MKAEDTTPKRRWVRTAVVGIVVALGLATSAGVASAYDSYDFKSAPVESAPRGGGV